MRTQRTRYKPGKEIKKIKNQITVILLARN